MFTEDSEKGIEVLEGIEMALRCVSIMNRISYGSELRIIARRILNDVNEFMPVKYGGDEDG